jgi:hypothetical protein
MPILGVGAASSATALGNWTIMPPVGRAHAMKEKRR